MANATRTTLTIAVTAALATGIAIDAPRAATLTNLDAATHKVRIMEKSGARQHELKPRATLTGICADGCIIRLNESAENDYILEGTERVSIERGLVYYDGEEAKKAAPGAAAAATSSETPKR